MPDDAIVGVAKHIISSCNHQSTCMSQLQPVTVQISNILLRRDEGKPYAVDRASSNIGTHSGLELATSGSTLLSLYTPCTHPKKEEKAWERKTEENVNTETHLTFQKTEISTDFRYTVSYEPDVLSAYD